MITLAEAQRQTRQFDTAETAILEQYIDAASAMVMRYIGDRDVGWTPPADVKMAVQLLVGLLYADREGELIHEISEYGYLPLPVTNILYSHRMPVVM